MVFFPFAHITKEAYILYSNTHQIFFKAVAFFFMLLSPTNFKEISKSACLSAQIGIFHDNQQGSGTDVRQARHLLAGSCVFAWTIICGILQSLVFPKISMWKLVRHHCRVLSETIMSQKTLFSMKYYKWICHSVHDIQQRIYDMQENILNLPRQFT